MSYKNMLKDSNLYAERVYAEHPLALWPFDDDISFLQLFSSSEQDLFNTSNWSYLNLNTENIEEYPSVPILQSPQSRFSLSSSPSLESEINSLFSVTSSSFFSNDKSTACFSAHVYQTSIFISYFRIGIKYDDEEYYTEYTFDSSIGWHKISHTFDIPENKEISFFIKVKFSEDSFATEQDFKFQVNGVSLGQWSEQYNSNSIGFNDTSLPLEISHIVSSSSNYTVVTADSYGTDTSNNGYFLIKDKEIFSRNSGLPLIYGSKNSTRILPAKDNNPSILLPGQGFLNESGRYNSYTLEAWVRLDNLCADPIKIIGPIFSDDGIYVEEGFISIRVGGKYTKSYFVGKWYRPMLLHLKYNQDYVTLYLNGEEVISERINISECYFAEKEVSGLDQDWIGIFGNDLIDPFEIDCVSIMPYDLPIEMAKRRFVYGQGVEDFESSTSFYSSEKNFFDYSNSEYASNMIYPDMNRWRDALSVNLNTTSSYMSAPEYQLPTFDIDSTSVSYDDWKSANKLENINYPDNFKYFKLKPSSINGISELTSSLYFENINILNEKVRSIIAVFKADSSVEEEQPLLIFKNNSTLESIRIILSPDVVTVDGGNSFTTEFDDFFNYGEPSTLSFTGGDDFGSAQSIPDLDMFKLQYIYSSYTGQETVFYQEDVESNQYFNAGIDIRGIQNSYGSIIGNFFSSQEDISLTIGKYRVNNFLGRIYAVHFNNDFFFEKDISNYFQNGIIIQRTETESIYEDMLLYTANYSLLPFSDTHNFDLDIGVVGYWEDVQPLSYFGKYIYLENGDKYYDLDSIQFNIDAPRYSQIDPSKTVFYTNYDSLKLIYPQNNDLISAGTYENLSSSSANYSENRIETSIRSYITLRDYTDANKKQYSDYINTEQISSNNVIDFDYSSYKNTKYEIQDKTIIMTPKNNFENYYFGIHLEIKVRGINSRSFILRRMELSSLSFNDSAPTQIGTRYAEYVYPFSRNKYLFDYKKKNPVTIYKDSSPYLYLTDDSGIYVNEYDSDYTRGVLIPINKNKVESYNLGSLQVWTRYSEKQFSQSRKTIMSIIGPESNIEFYAYPEVDGKRAIVKAYDSRTGIELSNVTYFQDGEIVDYPIIYPKRWTSIIISFLDVINFNSYTGRIELYEQFLYNNIEKYIYVEDKINSSKIFYKRWFQVLYDETKEIPQNTWDTWSKPLGQAGRSTWRQASSSLELSQYTINGENIYNDQIGMSVSVTDDNSRLNIYSNGADVLTEVTWETLEKSPV